MYPGDSYRMGPRGPPRRPMYPGGGPGYGGYGGYGGMGAMCGDCGECAPYLLPGLAIIFLFLGWVFFLPAYAAPYWISEETTTTTTTTNSYMGLWQSCTKTTMSATKTTNCDSTTDSDNVDLQWYTGAQALSSMTLVCLIIATALIVYWLCSYSRYFCIKVIFIGLLLLGFVFLLIAVILFGANADDDYTSMDFDWGFYLADVAVVFLLFSAMFLMCIPSYESYPVGMFSMGYGPRYGPDHRDNFGFDYGAGRGPPPPPPMGMRGGPGMDLPGYPGRGGYDKGYSSTMPYGSRY